MYTKSWWTIIGAISIVNAFWLWVVIFTLIWGGGFGPANQIKLESRKVEILNELIQSFLTEAIFYRQGGLQIWGGGKIKLIIICCSAKHILCQNIFYLTIDLQFCFNEILVNSKSRGQLVCWIIPSLYPVMHTGLCLSLFIIYGKSRVICNLTSWKLTWSSTTHQENIMFDICHPLSYAYIIKDESETVYLTKYFFCSHISHKMYNIHLQFIWLLAKPSQ